MLLGNFTIIVAVRSEAIVLITFLADERVVVLIRHGTVLVAEPAVDFHGKTFSKITTKCELALLNVLKEKKQILT